MSSLPDDPASLRRRVTGKPAGLKESQAYPMEYAEVVHEMWAEQYAVDVSNGVDDEIEEDSDTEAPWDAWRSASAQCNWPEAHADRLGRFLNMPVDVPL